MGEIMEDLTWRLSQWAKGNIEAPQRVLMYPTNRCNLRCVFCYQQLNQYDFSDEMPKKKWASLTKELCEMGVKTLQISGGGEPMLVSDTVLEMMQIIKKHNVEGRLVNNGTSWNKKLVKAVVDIQWYNVIFSVDGPDDKANDFHRGVKGTFQKIKKGLKLFKETKEEKKTERPLIEFSSVLTKKNYKQISDLIKFAYEMGVKVITFEPVFVSNPYVHKIKMSKKQRAEFMGFIIPPAIKLADDLGIHTNLDTLIEVKKIEKTGELKEEIIGKKQESKSNNTSCQYTFPDAACFEPWLWPKIEANGEVGPCSSNTLDNENIKNKTFLEVWTGKAFTNFRQAIIEKRLPDGCSNCVSTHVPMNRRIKEKLHKSLKKSSD